ncbi:hypothetical protein JCM19046_2743 [Bacillus sp. JCM 19046]|nr:hypothetical protein JCM19045_1785 [Bacillus sp. JCM 19045]GAF18183.1 hypothetical protein JCM19046_2743 [Bacillus sp. JCM 19046]
MKTIRSHVEHLFRNTPQSKQTALLKEEIIENLEEKVYDLIEIGKNEEDAINKAIVDLGDIDDLISEVEFEQHEEKTPPTGQQRYPKLNLGFSLWGSALIIALFIFINYYYSPNTIWFVYPTFVVLWWPLAMFYYWRRQKGAQQ